MRNPTKYASTETQAETVQKRRRRPTLAHVLALAMKQVLVLSPSRLIAQPRGWTEISTMLPPSASSRYDEIHCIGAGSLLYWLLGMAGRAPRASKVVCHGPLVLPTADSCAEWLARDGRDEIADKYEWRQQAIALGFNGQLRSSNQAWLEPLMVTIAGGRCFELAEDFVSKRDRMEAYGRTVHRPAFEKLSASWRAGGRTAMVDVQKTMLSVARSASGAEAGEKGEKGDAGGKGELRVLVCKEDECELVPASRAKATPAVLRA